MRRLLLTAALAWTCHPAHAVNCALAAGANASAIQTAVTAAGTNSCTGTATGGTVLLAGTTNTITSVVTIPCGSVAIVITGASVTWPALPTVKITGPVASGWGFATTGNGCTNSVTIQNLEWDGAHPSPQGGGMVFLAAGTNSFTFQNNYCHGISSATGLTGQGFQDGCIYIDGLDTTPGNNSQTDSNILITQSSFGNPASPGANDCAAVMHQFGYTADTTPARASSAWYDGYLTDYGHSGGLCVGVGIHSTTNNLVISKNKFANIEQGIKAYAAGSSPGCTGGSGTCVYYKFTQTNDVVTQNHFENIHRIPIEMQQTGNPMNVTNNDVVNQFWPGAGSWIFSLPQGSGTTNAVGNVLIANVPSAPASGNQPAGFYIPGSNEFWGHGATSQELAQGYQGKTGSAVQWGYGGSPWSITNNIIQSLDGTAYINSEEGQTTDTPAISGNVTGQNLSALTSASPTITVPGSCSGTASVTMADAGLTNGVGPQGNTSIWYTTDGSTPVAGTSSFYSGAVSVACGATVKALGMWGAQSQPFSYPTGYGFVPSAVQTKQVPGGSTPSVTGVTFSLQSTATSLQVGQSDLGCATITYSSGTPQKVCGAASDSFGNNPTGWTSFTPATATIQSSGTGEGSVAALAGGTTNLVVSAGSFTSPSFTLTVSAPAPVQQATQISCPNTLTAAQTASCTCQAQFTGPIIKACTSPVFASDTPAVATINSSSGLMTGVGAGTTNITVASGGFTSSKVVVTVNSATPSATLASAAVTFSPASVVAGGTITAQVTCTYTLTAGGSQTTNCLNADQYGNDAASFTSSATGVATINSTFGVATGVAAGNTNIGCTVTGTATVTCTTFSLAVSAPQALTILGNNQFNTANVTYPNAINSTYAMTGSAVSNVSSCSFYLPTGYTYATGSKWDCGVILAPTATTQASSWLCHSTYTTLGTSADVGWHTLPLTGCGNLPASTGYWVGVNTNESGPIGEGAWNCGSSCNGSAPSSGNGTYHYWYVSATYGVYTGMSTTMQPATATVNLQSSQYATLTGPNPVLVSGYLTTPSSAFSVIVGQALQITAVGCYSDGNCYFVSPTADQYGDSLQSITSSAPSILLVNGTGSANPALATGESLGTSTITAVIGQGSATKPVSPLSLTVSAIPTPVPTLNSRSLSAR